MKSFLKNSKKKIATAFLVVAVVAIGTSQAVTSIPLGTAADFAVLGGSGVTNAYSSTFITGDVGSSPTPAVTGLTPAMVNGNLYLTAVSATASAHSDLMTAYAAAAGAASGGPGPANLGGTTLLPGVYTYATTAPWTAGTLTLDGNSEPNAQWIFQIGTTLITPADAKVLLINGASADNVFWQIGSSLTLGATNTFAGNILASESITLGGGTLNGRALAINGAVSISSAETIDLNPGATIPEPETAGNILVYKTSTTATVFDFNAQTTRRETMKGYLVLDVNLTSQKVLAAQHVTYSGTTQQTEVVDVVFHDDVPGYIVLEYSGDNYDAVLYGKDPNTDIGLGLTHKKPVAKSLRGHLLGSNDSGSGIMNATLDTVWTKAANKNEDPITTVVDDIVNYLVGKKFYYPSFIQTQINEAIAERNGDEPVTVTIGAGTYNEDLVIDEPNVTLKSARGKATTIITPGAAGQGVIEISGDNVTIDGFTIRHGTQASSVASPQEHTIWVHANNSTIKNCTIIGAGGNQACIFIGGRNGASGKAIYRYNATAGTTEGHTIQNNTFRYGTATTGSGEGWGIFAVKLTDDCLIKGNTFKGDAADVGHWNTNEGAPGTGIVIHSAAKGSGTNAVIIEDNTAQYVKYSWLTFNASYPYNDNLILGNFYEQPEDSTVEDVIVRDNTAHDLGKDALNKSGVAITFTGQDKDDSLTPANADLTIGAGGVTIRNNALYNNACGVYIAEPGSWDDITYGCVITANNITINPDNSIYGNITDGPDSGYGVYNGTIEDNQDGGAVNVDAGNNWWGAATGPYDVNNTSGAGNQVSTGVDYTPYRTTAP